MEGGDNILSLLPSSRFTDMKVSYCFEGNNVIITKLLEVKSLREGAPRIMFDIRLDDEFMGDDGTSS